MDVEDNEVPLAPNPDDGEGAAEEGETDETEDVEMPDDGDDENHDHDADDDIDLDSAIFSVRMKANETIVAVGAAYYIPSTQTIPGPSNDNDNTDDKTDDTQQPENPDANNPGEEELPDGEIPKGTLTEEELAQLAAAAEEAGLSEEELQELVDLVASEGLTFEELWEMITGAPPQTLEVPEEPEIKLLAGETLYYKRIYVGDETRVFHSVDLGLAGTITAGGVVNTRVAKIGRAHV